MPSFLRLSALVLLVLPAVSRSQVIIDHRWSNTDAQSLIGLPMGSHKTIVDKKGNLKWSQWSLKRRELDSPIGFSMQMDGELVMEASSGTTGMTVTSQQLYQGRYPFIVSKLTGGGLELEELAFAADPDAKPGVIPTKLSGARGLDVVRLTFRNPTAASIDATLKLSAKERNLPGHVHGAWLQTNGGEDIAMIDAGGASTTVEDKGLALSVKVSLTPNATKTVWIRLPYEWHTSRNGEVSRESGEALLHKAVAQWNDLWSHGTHVVFPQREITDFYYSSLAYVLILTEFDAQGDLWMLDGPAVYRQYWGRGEYFQARALEVAGLMQPAKLSVEHALHIISDDGEWDGPPVSGWPAWDNAGGNMGAVWEYYQFARDKPWLAAAYPKMLRASEWIRDHREETQLEGVDDIPTGAKPIKRMLTGSKCRPEPEPKLAAGEKTYWYGLLPWSYGDSGLPEGHSFSHNFLAAYGEQVTADAARALGHTADAGWLDKEYAAYTADIRESVRRAVTLEKTKPAYLPAMPTYPEGAYSQTFLAVYPTQIYKLNDPLVDGLLTRMEHEESQGLPTNVAWAGPAGIWAGESMNMAETYLLRGEKKKANDMFVAALNHSYTTNVWKEEILTNVDAPRACDTPHSKRDNQEGTGDMPEAWANANLVLYLRDMLLNERDGKLHLLAGLESDWVPVGKSLDVDGAPVTTGGKVTLNVMHTTPTAWKIIVDPMGQKRDFVLHLDDASSITIGGKSVPSSDAVPFTVSTRTIIQVETK